MQVVIIGSGSVGGSLARGWARKGHTIVFGARSPKGARLQPLLAELGSAARSLPIVDAVRQAEVVVLATPWEGTIGILQGAGDLAGRILIDATNPLAPQLSGLTVGHTDSAAEQIARAAPGARVVKCFNTTGANNYLAPAYPEGAATMFYCGDDAAAKETVRSLGADLGFDMVDAGGLRQARLLEPLALLWISLVYPQGMGRDIAFRLMRK